MFRDERFSGPSSESGASPIAKPGGAGYVPAVRASHGRLARLGFATLLVAIAGSAVVAPRAFGERPAPEQVKLVRASLDRALERDPGVLRKAWFLRKASVVNYVLPVTIRLLPVRDGEGHFVSNDQVGNYATLDLGQSLGQRAIGLGGYVDGLVRFHDAFDSDQIGNVDITLLPDDAPITSTSVGLLTNPDVSVQAAGQNHVDLLNLDGATGGSFDVNWVDPAGASHTAAGIPAAGLTASSLTLALQAVIGGNNVFASQTGAGRFDVEFSGKYSAPVGALNSIAVGNNTTGAPISVTNLNPGSTSAGGYAGFSGNDTSADVDTLDKMQPSLTPGTNNVGPNWQWTPLGGTSEKDVVLRTGPLTLTVANPGTQAMVPAGDNTGNRPGGTIIGYSGGKANLFGPPVDGLSDGNSVDVTVNLETQINSFLRLVDDSLPAPAGQPDEAAGNIGAYFDCRQVWTGSVENYLEGIHLVGALHISPAITADGRLRIAKVFLRSKEPSRQALSACLVPYALFAAGNTTLGDARFTTAAPWGANPIGPDLIDGAATSAAFNPTQTINPDANAAAPDVQCDTQGGPLDRNPFNVNAGGANYLTDMMQSGAVASVAGDLTVQRLVGEVILGPAQLPPAVAPEIPSAQIVAGIKILPGDVGVKGKTGCVANPFTVSVKGTSISKIGISIDGKTVRKFRSVGNNAATIRVDPRRYPFGVHRIVAKVQFTSASGTKARTLQLTFQRCGQALVKPRFTG